MMLPVLPSESFICHHMQKPAIILVYGHRSLTLLMLSYSIMSAVLQSKWWLNIINLHINCSTNFLQRRLMQHHTTCNLMECSDLKLGQFDCQLQRNNELDAVGLQKKSTILSMTRTGCRSRETVLFIFVERGDAIKVLFYI